MPSAPSLPIDPSELQRSCRRCGEISESPALGNRKQSVGDPSDLYALGHGHRRVQELQASSVERLRQQRICAYEKDMAARIDRRNRAG